MVEKQKKKLNHKRVFVKGRRRQACDLTKRPYRAFVNWEDVTCKVCLKKKLVFEDSGVWGAC